MIKLFILVFVLVIFAIIGAFLWPYTLNTWLEFFGKTTTITHFQGALLGFCPIIGQLTILLAIATWILMLFIK